MRTRLPAIALGTLLAALAGRSNWPLEPTIQSSAPGSSMSGSRSSTPVTAPKSESRTYSIVGQEIQAVAKGVDAEGNPTTVQWTVNYDGKDRPATGSPDLDALSLKRIDAFKTEFTQKRAGKVASSGTRVISKDGKVMTISTRGPTQQGRASATSKSSTNGSNRRRGSCAN